MNNKERETLTQFMRLVLNHLHPNYDEYPIKEMKSVRHTQGDEFKGTFCEYAEYLLEAFYMNECIETIEKE